MCFLLVLCFFLRGWEICQLLRSFKLHNLWKQFAKGHEKVLPRWHYYIYSLSMSTMGLLDALKKIEKIIKENAFKQIKKKKCRLKFNLGLALISLSTTEPWRKSIARPKHKVGGWHSA